MYGSLTFRFSLPCSAPGFFAHRDGYPDCTQEWLAMLVESARYNYDIMLL